MITSTKSVLFECKGISKPLRIAALTSALAFITACSASKRQNKHPSRKLPQKLRLLLAPVAIQETQTATTEVDSVAEHFDYESITGISGNLSSIGSDTLANLMTLWTEGSSATTPASTYRYRQRVPLRHRLL